MNTKDQIIQELDEASDLLLEEVLDFVKFLKVKQTRITLEEKQDIEDSEQALAEAREKGTTSLKALKTELGL